MSLRAAGKCLGYAYSVTLDGVEGLDDMQKAMIRANNTTNLTALQGYHGNVANAVLDIYMRVDELDHLIQF